MWIGVVFVMGWMMGLGWRAVGGGWCGGIEWWMWWGLDWDLFD